MSLRSCVVVGSLMIGRAIHDYTVRAGFELLVNVSTTLVDMYAKCGLIGIARLVFDVMRVKNVVSWNSMIDGYAQCGNSGEVMALFERLWSSTSNQGRKFRFVFFIVILRYGRYRPFCSVLQIRQLHVEENLTDRMVDIDHYIVLKKI